MPRSRPCRLSSGSASPASSGPGAGTGVLSSTFTGVSSAASTGSAASAAIIASSNPAALSRASTRATALSTQPAETSAPSSMPISRADRSAGTFPKHDSSTAAAFSTGPQHTAPACRPGGGLANVTVPQPPHASPGSRYSVTFRRISTSMTCAHRGSIVSAPSRDAWHDRHSAGRSAVCVSSGSGSRSGPFPWWPGCPPRLRSLRRSRSDCWRAFRASFAPIRSFELGVPESVLSIDRRRSSSATRNSSRRSRSPAARISAAAAFTLETAVPRLAVSDAICSSFARITARSRETRPPCSPAAPGSSDTNRKHAQPARKVQPPTRAGALRSDPVNGHLTSAIQC